MSEKLNEAGLSGWRAVWKTLIALLWHFGNLAANGAYIKWIDSEISWVDSWVMFAGNFLLLGMAMGLDALAIARALGWGRGDKALKPQPFYNVEPPERQTP